VVIEPEPKQCRQSKQRRREDSRHFRKTKKKYLTAQIGVLETNSKIKKNIRDLYRGISDFKKGYHPTTNIVKGVKGDLVTDCHIILVKWRNHFSQLLNVHGVRANRNTYTRAECLRG
jgi:hypothetical protein